MRRTTGDVMVDLRGVSVSFRNGWNTVEALHQVSLQITAGSFTCIVGPNGSGKSSIVNVIARILKPTNGDVHMLLSDCCTVGYMMQEDALLPWRSVRGNVELPLELEGIAASQRQERALAALQMVGLTAAHASRRIDQLSGGERKRLSLAAALVSDPSLLLLDEPCSELDWVTKRDIHLLIQKLAVAKQMAVVAVTHDLAEAVFLGDRIHLMSQGRIVATVTTTEPRPRELSWRESDEFNHAVSQLEDSWTSLAP